MSHKYIFAQNGDMRCEKCGLAPTIPPVACLLATTPSTEGNYYYL